MTSLPEHGALDWDTPLNNAVQAATADAAEALSNSNSAQSNANYARDRADYALARTSGSGFVNDPDDPDILIVAVEGRVAQDATDPDILVITY